MNKAQVIHKLGAPESMQWENWPLPDPAPGEVRLRHSAIGVNFADTLVVKGRYQEKPPLPFAPGMEIAGTVASVGDGVDLAPGARVVVQSGTTGPAAIDGVDVALGSLVR